MPEWAVREQRCSLWTWKEKNETSKKVKKIIDVHFVITESISTWKNSMQGGMGSIGHCSGPERSRVI